MAETIDRDDIFDDVVDVLSGTIQLNVHAIRRKTHFINDLGMDSLDCQAFVMEIEDEFSIDVPDKDAAKIETVGQMVDYVAGKLEAKKGLSA